MKTRFFSHTMHSRWILVAYFMLLFAAVRAGNASERDPYWEARAGWENLSGHPLVGPDRYSWTAAGELWYPNSPAWNSALGAAFHFGGYPGLFWLTFGSIALYLTLAWTLAGLLGARALPGLLGIGVPLLLATVMISGRATMVVQSLLLLSVLAPAWWSERASRYTRSINGLVCLGTAATLSLVGNWVHLSYLLLAWSVGLVWTLMWWLTPGLSRSRRLVLSAAGFAGASVGVVVSPYGLLLGIQRSRSVQEACEGLIDEWASILSTGSLNWVLGGTVALGVSTTTVSHLTGRWRDSRSRDIRFRVTSGLIAIGLPSAIAGWGATRFVSISLLVIAPLIAASSTEWADRAHRRVQDAQRGFWALSRVQEYTSGRFWMLVLVCVAIVLTPFGLTGASRQSKPEEVEILMAAPAGCRLFSTPVTGSVAILARPDITVAVDGRADLYGRERWQSTLRVLTGMEALPERASCVVLPDMTILGIKSNAGRDLLERMDADSSWVRAAERDGYVLWLPRPPERKP